MKHVVISDLHFGSNVCEGKLILSFLESLEPATQLIVNGDMTDSYRFKKYKKKHWKALDVLRRRKNTVFIAGNHEESREKATDAFGVEFFDSIIIQSGGKDFSIQHGHRWDDLLGKYPLLEHLGDFVYAGLQRVDKNHRVAKKVKHYFKRFIHCIEKVAKGALQVDVSGGVICGHTHFPTHVSYQGRSYWNSGCWTERPGTCVEIENGVVTLKVGNTA